MTEAALYAIGAGLGLLGSVATGSVNANLHKKTRDFNAQEAQKARDFQLEMWNKSNEYSSPMQTMQRLTEAGLNPNLYYDKGTGLTAASVPSASQASSNSTARINDPMLGQMLVQSYLQNKLIERDQPLKDSQTRMNNANASAQEIENEFKRRKLNADTESAENAALMSRLQVKFYQDTRELEKDLLQSNLDLNQLKQNREIIEQATLPQVIDAQLKEINERVANLIESRKLTQQQVSTEIARQALIYAQSEQAIASAQQARAYAQYLIDKNEREHTLNDAQVNNLKRLTSLTDNQIVQIQVNTMLGALNADLNYVNTLQKMFPDNFIGKCLMNADALLHPGRWSPGVHTNNEGKIQTNISGIYFDFPQD